jgi:hypothetical protein
MPEPAHRPEASGPGIPNINPVTGLSTDYLNHFTELLMALEMVADVPECIDDVRAWRPKTYAEHFATSRFTNRDTVIRMYQAADPALRKEVDQTSDALNRLLVKARDAALRDSKTATAGTAARHATADVRPLIAELAALINGTANEPGAGLNPQAAIDAMFAK